MQCGQILFSFLFFVCILSALHLNVIYPTKLALRIASEIQIFSQLRPFSTFSVFVNKEAAQRNGWNHEKFSQPKIRNYLIADSFGPFMQHYLQTILHNFRCDLCCLLLVTWPQFLFIRHSYTFAGLVWAIFPMESCAPMCEILSV